MLGEANADSKNSAQKTIHKILDNDPPILGQSFEPT